MEIWDRFKHLWVVLIGWAVFFLCVSLNHPILIGLGCIAGLILAVAGVVRSIGRLARSTQDVFVHGLAWTLAVGLGFLSAAWLIAVVTGV